MKRDVKVRIAAGFAAVALLAGIIASVVGPLTGNGNTGDPDSGSEMTTTTLTDEEYLAEVAAISSHIEKAQGVRCALSPAFEGIGTLPIPSTTTQTRARVEVTSEILGAAADSIEADDPEGAEAFDRAAAAVVAEAEDNDYSPSWFINLESLEDAEFQEAFSKYAADSAEECGRGTSDTTTTLA